MYDFAEKIDDARFAQTQMTDAYYNLARCMEYNFQKNSIFRDSQRDFRAFENEMEKKYEEYMLKPVCDKAD